MNKEHVILTAILMVVVSAVSFRIYTNSPDYLAKQSYDNAVALIAQGDYESGIDKLAEVARTDTDAASLASAELGNVTLPVRLNQRTPSDISNIFQALLTHRENSPQYYERAKHHAERLQSDAPIESSLLHITAGKSAASPEDASAHFTAAYEQLKKHRADFSANQEVSMAFAVLDERQNACALCPEILGKFEKNLGEHEAARALGQYYLATNAPDRAYALLQPYTKVHLQRYRDAEKAYNLLVEEIWQQTINTLDQGGGSEAFYKAYSEADESKQNELVNEVYNRNLDNSQELATALLLYQRTAAVVPVAMDLGILHLNRAMSMEDSQQQEEELSRAERSFLTVQSFASDSDDYQYYLGQVYYWLGKPDDGDVLFNALLAKYERSPAVLASLSGVLRNLGDDKTAISYIEEAYTTSTDKIEKENYAYSRSILATGQDRRIEWLEKSNLQDAFVKASLFTERAHKAAAENKIEKAKSLYQNAIDNYHNTPENTTHFNNIALVYMSKFDLSGNRQDYDKALDNMDKAVQLEPDDSIVLSNAADYYWTRIYQDILDSKVDATVFSERPSLHSISYFYGSAEEKQEYIAFVRNSAYYDKAMEYLRKASLLSPKNSSAFDNLYSRYRFLKMEGEQKQLISRQKIIGLDLSAERKNLSDYRAGVDGEKKVKFYDDRIDKYEILIKTIDKKTHSNEFAIVNDYVLRYRLAKTSYGAVVDIKEMLSKAQDNYQRLPSSNTRATYIDVLKRDLIETLKLQSDPFKTLHEGSFGIMSEVFILGLGIKTIPGLADKAKKIDSMKNFIDMIVASDTHFPENPSADEWYLLEIYGHEYAEEMKTRYLYSSSVRLNLALSEITLVNEEEVMKEQYLDRLIRGIPIDADAMKAEAESKQLNLPPAFLTTTLL